ncbi:MAG: helix-turn-helix domain-containing protein [Erysipelotrichaceae bacterium]|nr:helix-turn-helix domain-containing protein [Erysipelotrichaceae bacterium]
MSLGNNIRRLREEHGMTQENLAEELGVSFQAVSCWEREEYNPDLPKLSKMARIFDVSVNTLLDEEKQDLTVNKAIFDWQHMKSFVKTSAKNYGLTETLSALDYALEAHGDVPRKKSDIPYIYHPLNMACHCLAMGIRNDQIIAACLLHDVVEDCGKKPEELPVSERTRELVRLMSHEKDDEHRDEIMKEYYRKLSLDTEAALIKCLDRCNNLTTMCWGLSRERQYRMIRETEKYILPYLEMIRKQPEYNDAAWLLKYQITSMLEIYKTLL